jgi:adenosine deaminase
VFDRLEDHPLAAMLDHGMHISVNSDDPAYFGGYIGDNYEALATTFGWGVEELADIARMSITSSFLGEGAKVELIDEIGAIIASQSVN